VRRLISRAVTRLPRALRLRLARVIRPRSAYLLVQRTRPISRSPADRGTPVDRYYIERFLEENRPLIRGTCLEVMNPDYVRRFGGEVARVDVLDINRQNPDVTIYGDLRRLEQVPDDTYDCFVITQVFQYIDDVEAAVRETVRILKPGGTALVTLPALHKLESPTYSHYWRFTPLSAKYLFGRYFPDDHLHIQSWGNVLAGMAFWVGLAQEDLRRKHLDQHDPAYPCTITVRATKPKEAAGVPPAAPVRIGSAQAEPPRGSGSGLTWTFTRAMCLGLAATLGF
jgi:hypothetical protein